MHTRMASTEIQDPLRIRIRPAARRLRNTGSELMWWERSTTISTGWSHVDIAKVGVSGERKEGCVTLEVSGIQQDNAPVVGADPVHVVSAIRYVEASVWVRFAVSQNNSKQMGVPVTGK